MKIQVISDIHLENKKFVCENSFEYDILAICGDLGEVCKSSYFSFLDDVSRKFSKILVILGNHEFYHNEYYSVRKKVREFTQKYENIYLLDNDSLETNEAVFIGTTLWFSFPFTKYLHISNKLNDFKKILIKRENKPLTLLNPTDTQQFFNQNIQWLESQLIKYKNTDKKIVVLSHHAPLLENTSYQTDYLGFSTDLGFLFESYKIDYWLFGHTHKFTDFEYKQTRVISNPLDEHDSIVIEIKY